MNPASSSIISGIVLRTRVDRAGSWLLVVALTLACSADRLIYDAALPGTGTSATLEWLSARGGYLDVVVETAGKRLRFFLDGSEAACAGLQDSNAPVTYANSGPLGRLESGPLRCQPVGLLSLREWRSRQPRRGPGLVPRAPAAWSEVYRDGGMTLVRGRFPLASRVGWASGEDTVAVFGPDPACDGALARGVGTLVFYHGGKNVLAILGEGQLCPLLGLALPLAGSS